MATCTTFSRLFGQQVMRPLQFESRRSFNANHCVITRVRRSQYTRTYPTQLVFPNGSSLTIRYAEPRGIIQLPLTLEDLHNDKERTAWNARRKVKEVIVIKKDITDVNYDSSNYLKYI